MKRPPASRLGLAPSPLWGEGGGEGPWALAASAGGDGCADALLPRPSGERAGVRGQRRWIRSLLSDVQWFLLASAGRDMRPAAHLLSFASPKESRQRKGDPTGRVPSLRCGQPAMLAPGAVLRNSLCSLRSRRSDNRSKSDHEAWACCAAHARPSPCASRHGQRGVQRQLGPSLRSAAGSAVVGAERSDGSNGFATPLRLRLRRRACGVARAPQDARASWSDSRGLFERRERSERSEFHRAPRKCCGAGLPRSEAQGSQTWGRFLLPPFLVRTRKGGALPGAYPGQRMHAEPRTQQTTANISNALPLTPAFSPEGRGSKPGLIRRCCPLPQPSLQRGEGERPHTH